MADGSRPGTGGGLTLEEDVKEVARHALDGVLKGEDVDAGAVLDIRALEGGITSQM